MKLRFQNIRKFAPVMAAVTLVGVSQVSAGEVLRTQRGKVYHDCEVLSHDAFGLMIRHRDGAARLSFGDLTKDVQKRYKYDPAAARKFVKRHQPVPIRSSQIAHRRAIATHFTGFSPQLAATRAHLAFAGGLLGAPFGGSLGVPGVKSFNAWQSNARYANLNPYHSSHTYKVKNGNVVLNNRRKSERYNAGRSYGYAYRPLANRGSFLLNQTRFGNPIAPAIGVGQSRATNAANPIAPAMMSYSQFQAARAQAIRKSAPKRIPRVRAGKK